MRERKIIAYKALNGEFRYDLGLKKLTFTHDDIAFTGSFLPLTISHIYHCDTDNHGYGKGFSLNLEQKLVKDENTGQYKLVLPDGTEEWFEELYYIKNEKNREYLPKTSVSILPDGTLDYEGKRVYQELKNRKNMALSGDFTDFVGSEKIDLRNQELTELESTILQLRQTIANLEYNIYEYGKYGNEVYKDYLYSQNMYENANLRLSEYKNGTEYKENMTDYYFERDKYYDLTKKIERIVGGVTADLKFDEKLLRMTYKGVDSKDLGFRADKYNRLAKYGPVRENSSEMKIDSMSDNEKKAAYYEQEFQDAIDQINQKIQDLSYAMEKEAWGYQEQITDEECRYLTDKASYDAEVTSIQRKYYEKMLPLAIELKSYYEKQLNTKEYEKEKLSRLVPQMYLSKNDGLVSGFNAEGKLCLLFDAFEHQIMIEYNDLNRIERITDEKGNSISFIYNASASLIEINESEGRYIRYAYDEEGYLTKILYSEDTFASLAYEAGYLYQYIDIRHQGYVINYTDGEVKQIRDLYIRADTAQIHDRIDSFEYSDGFVILKNNKNEMTYHYAFDQERYLMSEYSLKDGTPYELTAVEEKDKCCSCTLSVPAGSKRIEVMDNIVLTEDNPIQSIPVSNLINPYSTDYILYAFGKADSVDAVRRTRKTAYCTHEDTDSTHTAYFEMRCTLEYDDETITYIAPFQPRLKTKQLAILPITLREDSDGKAVLPANITIFLDYRNNRQTCSISSVTMALGEYVYSEYNEAYHKISDTYSETITPKTVMGQKQGEYLQKKKVEYFYNYNELVEKEVETIDYEEYDLSGQAVDKTTKQYTKSYQYNSMNKVVREEDSKGNILDYIYNSQGLCIMKKSYAKSLPNQAFIEESVYDDDGKPMKRANDLGYYEEYKYINPTNYMVTSPNGHILNITSSDTSQAISSEIEGIENYNASIYEAGRLTEYHAEGMKYSYTYDEYGREQEFYINDKLYCTFSYLETSSTISYKTLYPNDCGFERITDKYGNTLKINKIIGNTAIRYLEYELDSMGRIIKERQYIHGSEYLTSYKYIDDTLASVQTGEYTKSTNYDMAHREAETTYQFDKAVIRYKSEYKDEQLDRYSVLYNDEEIYAEQFQFDKLNRIVNLTNPLLSDNFTYLTKNGRTTNLVALNQKRLQGKLQRYRYNYDKAGNIIGKEENHRNTRYVYDALNRLIREDNQAFNKTYIYTYDSNGNIISKGIYDYTLEDNLENEEIIRYNYNDFNDYLTSYQGQAIKYDSIGNPVLYRDKALCWKQRNLTGYDTYRYTYNSYNQRISKYTGDKKIDYILDGKTILKEIITYYTTYLYSDEVLNPFETINETQEEIEYLYSKQGIVGFRYRGEVYYYNKNIFGDILEIYDSNYNLVGKYEYDAWGNHRIVVNVNNIASINPFRYRSYYYDNETGLYYCSSRYYDPEVGRWISPDSIEYLDPESINGFNLYAYCLNNPVNLCDPSGHFVITLSAVLWAAVIGAAIGAVSGAVYGGITAAANGQNVWSGIGIGVLTGSLMGAGAGVASLFIAPVLVGEGVMVATATGAGFVMGNALSAGAALAIGTGIAFGSGAIGGVTSDMLTQLANTGRVSNWGSVGISALQWGLINTAGAYLGSVGGPLSFLETALVTGVFNNVTGGIGFAADVIRDRINKRKQMNSLSYMYSYGF